MVHLPPMISPIQLICLDLVLAVASLGVAFNLRSRALRDGRVILPLVSPALVMLVLFYSLAIHMHVVLGSWPVINTHGFPPRLLSHAAIAESFFSGWMLFMMFIWPLVFIACLSVHRLRPYLLYVGAHALAFLVCLGGMLLAPSGFLGWWWD
jgi:hypothetical protein